MFSPITHLAAFGALVNDRLTHRRRLDRGCSNHVKDRAGESLWGFLRRIMSDPRQHAALERPGEMYGVFGRSVGRMDTIGLALQGDRRHRDFGLGRQLRLLGLLSFN